MFRGDSPDLNRVMERAFISARSLGHPRVGSEHLLLALVEDGGTVVNVLTRHDASGAAVRLTATFWPCSVSTSTAYWIALKELHWIAPPDRIPYSRSASTGPVDGAPKSAHQWGWMPRQSTRRLFDWPWLVTNASTDPNISLSPS